MGTRARFRNYSIEQGLDEWVTPLVEHRVLGFTSKAQVMHYALRRVVDQYLEWGIHPWSTRKQQAPGSGPQLAAAILLVASIAAIVGLFTISPAVTGAAVGQFDVPRIYDEFAPFLDFFLYLAFFIGVVQVGLGKTIQNKAITISLATMLALGVASMEPVFGFTIRAFGPVAVGVFLLVAGLLVYRTLRAFEVHRLGAGAVIVVLLYLGLAAFLPDLNLVLTRHFPVLPLVIVLIVAVSVVKFSDGRFGSSTGKAMPREVSSDIAPGLAEEERLVRDFLTRTGKEAKGDARALLANLAELLEIIDRAGTVPEARNLLAQKLRQVLPRIHPIEAAMDTLDKLADQTQRIDLRLFVDLKTVYPKLSPRDQRAVRDEIREAMTKLGVEKKLKDLARRTREHTAGLRAQLGKAEQFLRSADLEKARNAIEQAIAQEQGAEHVLDEIKDLETALGELTRRELNSLPAE